MTQGGSDVLATAQIIGFALTMFTFFGAQAVALFIWYRKEKRDRAKERIETEERQKKEREKQLVDLKEIIDQDLNSVKGDLGKLREDLEDAEIQQRQRNEQLHGHMRRIEESRPSRQEMKEEIGQMKDLIVSVELRLADNVKNGFDNLNRRFDEFREYAKDLWGRPGGR